MPRIRRWIRDITVLKGIYLFLRRCALDLFNLNSDIRLRM